jgi:hypothetical protein
MVRRDAGRAQSHERLSRGCRNIGAVWPVSDTWLMARNFVSYERGRLSSLLPSLTEPARIKVLSPPVMSLVTCVLESLQEDLGERTEWPDPDPAGIRNPAIDGRIATCPAILAQDCHHSAYRRAPSFAHVAGCVRASTPLVAQSRSAVPARPCSGKGRCRKEAISVDRRHPHATPPRQGVRQLAS